MRFRKIEPMEPGDMDEDVMLRSDRRALASMVAVLTIFEVAVAVSGVWVLAKLLLWWLKP